MKHSTTLKKLSSFVRENLPAIPNKISELTGYAATRVPLKRGSRANQVTLAVPGYTQVDSFSCGAVAGFMALKYLRPRARFDQFYTRVNPDEESGASTKTVARALRQSGVRVRIRSDLTFNDLCAAIHSGSPVLVGIENPSDHWVVVYGYSRKPNRVFIASNRIPFFSNEISLRRFSQIWSPRGNGLICEYRKRRGRLLS